MGTIQAEDQRRKKGGATHASTGVNQFLSPGEQQQPAQSAEQKAQETEKRTALRKELKTILVEKMGKTREEAYWWLWDGYKAKTTDELPLPVLEEVVAKARAQVQTAEPADDIPF